MSSVERHGTRDLTYSAWHRAANVARFLGPQRAHQLTYIDLDAIEYCAKCREPLLLGELARDVGQAFKATRVLRRLAKRANRPAVLVFYRVGDTGDIERFRVRMVYPDYEQHERTMDPAEYAAWLWSFREAHRCGEPA